MRPAAALLVALLVVAAGCSSLPGSDRGPPGTTLPDDADAESPADSPTPGTDDGTTTSESVEVRTDVPGDRLLPGLAESGVVDADALAAAHAETLSERSYTLSLRRERVGAVGDRSSLRVDGAFGDNPGHLRLTLDADRAAVNRSLRIRAWGNGTHLHRTASQGDREEEYEVIDAPASEMRSGEYLLVSPTQEGRVARLLAAFEVTTVSTRETDDGTRYRLASETVADADRFRVGADVTVSNASLFAAIGADGVVRRLHVEYDVDRGDDSQHRVYDLRVTAVGRTTVERPAWVRRQGARADTPPGLGRDDVTDVDALVTAHERGLRGGSYTLSAQRRNWLLQNWTVDAAFSGDGRFRWALTVSDPRVGGTVRRRVWSNGTHLHRLVGDGDGDDQYGVLDFSQGRPDWRNMLLDGPTQTSVLRTTLTAFAVGDVRVRNDSDGTRYVLDSRTVAEPAVLPGGTSGTVENGSLHAVVDGTGVVRELHVAYDLRRNGTVERRAYALRVTEVGTTTVERPDWVRLPASGEEGDGTGSRNGTGSGAEHGGAAG